MYEQYVRLPHVKGQKVCGMGRAKIYEVAKRHPKIFRRLDGITLVDLKYLNNVIAKCPAGPGPVAGRHRNKARAA